MFHVKHFGTIGAKNLTSAHTPCDLETCGIARNVGIFGGWMARPCAASFGRFLLCCKALGRPLRCRERAVGQFEVISIGWLSGKLFDLRTTRTWGCL